MKHTTRWMRRKTAVLLFPLVAFSSLDTFGADADLLKEFHPYAQIGIGHDTNVFRVDDPAQAVELSGGSEIADTFTTIETGFNSQLSHRRQLFRLHGRVFHDNYNRFDAVDFTGGDAKAGWDWVLGTRWNGAISYEFRRGLRDFANQSVPRIDIGSSNLISAAATRQLNNRWRLTGTTDVADIKFSRENGLDLRRAGYGASLAYTSRKDNAVSLDANYLRRQSQGPINLDYTDLTLGPAVDWRISDRSKLRAALQYEHRDQNDPALLDYAGLTGRITNTWTTASDSSLTISLWRQVSSLADEIANFAIITGVSVDPTVRIGRRTSLGVEIGYEARDFKGEPEIASLPSQPLAPRKDKLLTAALLLDWRFTDNSALSFQYGGQNRDSTRIGRNYDFSRVQMNFRVGL